MTKPVREVIKALRKLNPDKQYAYVGYGADRQIVEWYNNKWLHVAPISGEMADIRLLHDVIEIMTEVPGE